MAHRVPRSTFAGLMLTGALVSAQTPSSSQQGQAPAAPPVTFKTEIAYVEVSARVLDDQGNFVAGLTKDDCRVFEDGKAQTIDAFSLVRIPIDRAETPSFVERPVEPDAVANTPAPDGRLYVFALDELHTDPLRSQRVKDAARRFIEEDLAANDLAAVSIIGNSLASQELTGNRGRLLAAVDKFVGQKPTDATLVKIQEYNRLVSINAIDPGGDVSDPYVQERIQNSRRMFRALTRMADWMGAIRGRRKTLIYISEGVGFDLRDTFRDLNGASGPQKVNALHVYNDTRAVIEAATRSNVNIYSIDPRGVGAGADVLIEARSAADAGNPVSADDPRRGNGQSNLRTDLAGQSINNELQTAQDGLRMLSEQTGGFAILNTADLETGLARIVDENSAYYIVGYRSTNDRRDGKFRTIDVRLPNRAGLMVRARRGYLAPSGKSESAAIGTDKTPNASAQLRELLRSPVPMSGVSVSATAATFRGQARNGTVVVAVEARAGDLKFTEKGGRFTGRLSVGLAALDYDGNLRASAAPTLDFGLKPETYQRIAKEGNVRLVSQLALPPGRYQLRAALLDDVAGNGGSVQYDLDVPDFSKAALSLSGVMLTSAQASAAPTVADSLVDPRLPEPTSIRQFGSSDELGVYVEVYDNVPGPPHRVDVVTTVRTGAGRVVFRNEQERSSDDLQRRRELSSVIIRFPLKELQAGLHVLTVEARPRTGNMEPVSQMVQFRIR